ncbi:hypothetical protein Tco_1015890 [Tanacetum coccineum]|uniref:Uncharacterized protein n=1 Tax=Tanacetum coccineum TaxID=301880 RepID=A0ABQ5FNC8_9ASTR
MGRNVTPDPISQQMGRNVTLDPISQQMGRNVTLDPISQQMDSGANERPSMVEKGSYIPWESRFRRILDNNFADGERMELQGDSQEDNLITAMMLLGRAITQKFSTPTNSHLCTSSNTRDQAVIQDDRVDIQTKKFILMARIQPTDGKAEIVPSYDSKAVSEVNASSKVHEQVSHVKCKTIIQTSDDDQINSNIIFDDPYVENNGGTSEHDSNAHDEYHEIQVLAYNVQREVEN